MTNPPQPLPVQLDALTRLTALAKSDGDGALSVANFLLAWDDAPRYGGFDFRDLWVLDPSLVADIHLVIDLMVECPGTAPHHFGLADDLTQLAALWRRHDDAVNSPRPRAHQRAAHRRALTRSHTA